AQDLTARVLPNGTHTFRRMLLGSGLKPVKDLKELVETAPEKTLLIVFGDLRGLHQVEDTLPEGLAGFWEKNGAILVASDRAEGAHFLANVFGVSPDGEILTAANVKKAYLGELKCPYVTEFESHPLFKGVSRLATNTPTFLRGRSGKYPHLAWLPKG